MKKTLIVFGFVAFAAIAMSSCKKDFVCECSYAVPGLPAIITTHNLDNVTKSDAKSACDDLTVTSVGTKNCQLK